MKFLGPTPTADEDLATKLTTKPWWWAPPLEADFTNTDLAGSGTVTDDADVGLIIVQPGANVPAFNGVRKPISSGVDWWAQTHINYVADNTNYSNRSLIVCDGSVNKAVWWGWDNRQICHFMHLLMSGTFDGYEVNRGMAAPVGWFRYEYVAATGILTALISGDGKQWIPVTTDNVKSYFSADPSYIGLGVETSAAAIGTYMSVDHYSDNI